ncbi:centrosomal protein of 41 kDa isoform X2 [Equus przewalskii]|uniref:Centrosomal protein of 41 kDa n=2 Tax=Equus TaxID=9789 RepID=A0A3Q2HUT2_HORSE|nr:PREDICTED: centrosomal protein of 41 kDa isoform X1 [Equus przewalskii]XP_014594614.1 centrosomal protein of 41 kDa isoform X2 [Equus caballus]
MNEAPNTEGTKSKGAIVSDYGDTGRAGISRPSRLERMQNMTLVLRASRKYLTRRIPQNPKYQHVKSRLDTGNSMTKYIEKLEEIKKNYRYKKDELFKRLKVTTFAQLVIQVASLSDQTLEVTAEEIQRLEDNDSAASDPDAEIAVRTNGKGSPGEQSLSPVQFIHSAGAGDSSRSTLQSVISGVGELDVDKGLVKKAEPNTKDKPYPDCPFLLLDVRDRDSYQQCHIVGAYSYPIATLSRTMNPYSNDILEYKNAHGKIIILYDDDERLASQAATTMCERGFENLFMLSGGLKVLAQKFPEGLITGSLPASCQQALPPGSARKRASPKVPPLPAENKWRFTPEDLRKIEYYLEEDQGPADNPSRLSQANASGRDSKVPGPRSTRSGQNLPTGGPAGHLNPRSLGSGHLQGKPWK